MSDKFHLPYLETMLSYSCTLSCAHCSNYSDYQMKGGYVPWLQAKTWLDHWTSRMSIGTIGLIGGEPLLNPELKQWIHGIRDNFPSIDILVVTNAQLFTKNLWLLDTMENLGRFQLKFSVHQPNAEYLKNAIEAVHSKFTWDCKEKNDVAEHYRVLDKKIEFQIMWDNRFIKTYRGSYDNMLPYNNNPAEAFNICSQQTCPLLEQGKLYKCSTVGVLHRVLQDHNQIESPDWQPFLNTGINFDCSDTELEQFVNNYSKPHSICKMCPTEKNSPYRPHWPLVVNRTKIT